MNDTIDVIYVNHNKSYTPEQFSHWQQVCQKNMPNVRYSVFHDIRDLFPKLSDPSFNVDYINLDIEFLDTFFDGDPYAIVGTLKMLAQSTLCRATNGKTKKRTTKIIGCVRENSNPTLIRNMMPFVDGLCMSLGVKWTCEMILADQKRITSGDLSNPCEIKKLLSKKKEKSRNTINLTPRQKQVLVFVTKKGASNKVIAKALRISESTVKLHVGAILKKYGLKNRTQLAVFSKEPA